MFKKPYLSLCIIVRPSDDEAPYLDRCLASVADYVDEIVITITGKNKEVEKVAKKYKANISYFEWKNDFALARNFNFRQAKGEWIIWLDADDVLKGKVNELKELCQQADKENVKLLFVEYQYDFDQYGDCIVKHKKGQIVKWNEGIFNWVGELHEEFEHNRLFKAAEIKEVVRVHTGVDERNHLRQERNLTIAKKKYESNPKDATAIWNYANTLIGAGKVEQAIQQYINFIAKTGSEEEQYLAWLRLSQCYDQLGESGKAIESALEGIRLRPEYPDPYLQLGTLAYHAKDYKRAKVYLLDGLRKVKDSPHEDKTIVWNPRNYDFNPLMTLFNVYYSLGEAEQALHILETLNRMFPKNENIPKMIKELKTVVDELNRVDKAIKEIDDKTKGLSVPLSREEVQKWLDNLPQDLLSHPKVSIVRNMYFIKKESSGKDLVIYCGQTAEEWNPDSAKTGIGGSEEAVINISNRLADKGWNVTVYANTGFYKEKLYGKVSWKPYWLFNYRDKQDIFIAWRHPMIYDYNVNATKKYVWMHDVISKEEYTPQRVKNIDKIIVLSKWHRSIFPNVADEKFLISANGINLEQFNQKLERNSKRLIYTSAQDRGMELLLQLFRRVKEKVPEATLDMYYGWTVFDNMYKDDPEKMAWKARIVKMVENTEGATDHGRIGHEEIAKEYLTSAIWAYPTEFTEISCITGMKAQAAGCIPVTTTVAALNETVQFGTKLDYSDIYTNKQAQEEWVKKVVYLLNNPNKQEAIREKMIPWAKSKFSWDNVANQWHNEFK